MCLQVNSDADFLLVNSDAPRFFRGYTNPLAMMGVALNRYLPGGNAMLVTTTYVVSKTKCTSSDVHFALI